MAAFIMVRFRMRAITTRTSDDVDVVDYGNGGGTDVVDDSDDDNGSRLVCIVRKKR